VAIIHYLIAHTKKITTYKKATQNSIVRGFFCAIKK
jgi:hypothetical protein